MSELKENPFHPHMIEINKRPHNPAVLFIHGISDCWFSWKDYLRLVDREGWHGIAVDYDPTQSLEEQLKDLRSLISAYGEKTFMLVGCDWGGLLASILASENPEKFSGLVLINPFVHGLSLTPRDEFIKNLSIFRTFTHQDEVTYRKLLKRRKAFTLKSIRFRKTVRVPALLLWGEQDVSEVKEKLRNIGRFFTAGISQRFFPSTSRYPHLENFTETANELLYFMSINRFKSQSTSVVA